MASFRLPLSCAALSVLDGHTDVSSPAVLAAHTRQRPSLASSSLPERLAPYSAPLDDTTAPRTSLLALCQLRRLWDQHRALSPALLDVQDVPAAPSLGQLACRTTTPFGAANLVHITQDSTPRPQRATSGKNPTRFRKNEIDLRSRSKTHIRGSVWCPPPTRDLRCWHGLLRRSTTQSAHTSSGMQPAYRPGSPPTPTTANTPHTHIHACKTVLHVPPNVALAPRPLQAASLRYRPRTIVFIDTIPYDRYKTIQKP
ncbi:hypothetical protein VTO73DRAFT_14518 [Trametes versicolor]